jgi:hypothetical protein
VADCRFRENRPSRCSPDRGSFLCLFSGEHSLGVEILLRCSTSPSDHNYNLPRDRASHIEATSDPIARRRCWVPEVPDLGGERGGMTIGIVRAAKMECAVQQN